MLQFHRNKNKKKDFLHCFKCTYINTVSIISGGINSSGYLAIHNGEKSALHFSTRGK